jgi:large subunit ribosomal protein L4
MAKVQVMKANGEVSGEVELPAGVFSYPVKEHLLYESVVQRQAGERRGTASAKTRAEVTGSNRKPWRQKGTGRARVGSLRNPLWRKGGTVHGPRQRDYGYEIPKQARRNALKSALAMRWIENRLLVVDDATFEGPKTREAAKWLKGLNLKSALVVDLRDNHNLFLAMRNIPGSNAVDAVQLAAFDILKHEWLVLTRRALESLRKRFKK